MIERDENMVTRRLPLRHMAAMAGMLFTAVALCQTKSVPVGQESPERQKNSVGMEFAKLSQGVFQMGSPQGEKDRLETETLHRVGISKKTWMGVHEVTQAQYARVTGESPSHFKGDNLPVEKVSYDDAVDFCRKLSALPQELAAGRSYRLPTEAEWEYACRAGTTTPFHFGDATNGTQANHDGTKTYGNIPSGPNLGKTAPVGSYPANAWGLYDMHGNVWEWCADWYGPLAVDETIDPQGAAQGTGRVLRGGSWANHGKNCRAADRYGYDPASRKNYLGFRVVLEQKKDQPLK